MMMVYGRNTTLLCYELLEGNVKPTLHIRPMLAYRDIHSLTRENMFLRPKSFPEKNGRKIQPYEGMPCLYMGTNRTSEFFPGPKWSLNVEYLIERDRGFDYQEDLFAGHVRTETATGQTRHLCRFYRPARQFGTDTQEGS